MKIIVTLLLAVAVSAASLAAAEKKAIAGPKGGRLFETKPLKTEFFVTKDRKVEVNFYDQALKPAAPSSQVVAVTAEPKSGRVKLDLDKAANGFVSKTALPASEEPYRVVVQIRENANTQPQNFRVDLNLDTCGECKLGEYACICGH